MNKLLRWLAFALVALAAVCSIGLLVGDSTIPIPLGLPASAISAAPLLLIGISLLIVQAILRPRWPELLKNMLLATAFILWSVVQLMEPNALSKRLGDVVIALYVLDLAWVILAGVTPPGTTRSRSPKSDSSNE